MTEEPSFKLTYSTMFNPPEELHTRYGDALAGLKANMGQEFPMLINGREVYAEQKHQAFSPINRDWHLATFQKGISGCIGCDCGS